MGVEKIILLRQGIIMFSRKDLSRLIVPLFIEQVLAVTIGMADTIMVSSVGEAAVSAVSLVDAINILLINVFSALATGGAIVASQYLGADDPKNARKASSQLVVVTFLLASVIMVICLAANVHLLRFVFGNAEDAVMNNCKIYFIFSAISYPFLALYNAGAALFRAIGNSKVSMYISTVMNIINVAGNAILIYGFNMGVAGAAIATLAARVFGAIFITVLLKNPDNIIHIESFTKWKPDKAMIKNILKIGIPNGLESGMFQIGRILTQQLITSFGTIAIAANTVAASISAFSVIPGNTMALALITVVGQCVGADNYKEAKKYTYKLLAVNYAAVAVINILIIIFIGPVVGIYNLSAETAEIAKTLVVWQCVFSIVFWPASFALPSTLRAAGDAKFTMVISTISMWTFRIFASYIIAGYMGIGVLGVTIAMTIDWMFRAVCFTVRFFSGKWMNKKVI